MSLLSGRLDFLRKGTSDPMETKEEQNPLALRVCVTLQFILMKSDAQLRHGVFNVASLFLPYSPYALFLVPDLFSLCFYSFCSSKTGCCLARRAAA